MQEYPKRRIFQPISYYCITVQDLFKTCSKIDQNRGQNDGQNLFLNCLIDSYIQLHSHIYRGKVK